MAGVDAARYKALDEAYAAAQPKIRYGEAEYWSQRYAAKGEPYDWYLRWEQLKEHLLPLLSPEAEILIVGCGTSTLTEQLFTAGFTHITNIDRCESLIRILRDKYADKASLKYLALDAAEMPEDWTGRFDVAIDKAMLDAVACSPYKMEACSRVLRAISRVLKPGSGVYVSVSHADPKLRRPMLVGEDVPPETEESEELQWRVSRVAITRPLINPNLTGKEKDKVELTPSALYKPEDCVYHVYICHRT